MQWTPIYTVLIAMFLLSGCSEKPVSSNSTELTITEDGRLLVNGEAVGSPPRLQEIENVLGSPSKIVNIDANQYAVWHKLGLGVFALRDGAVRKVNLQLQGSTYDDDLDPQFLFNGSLSLPTGRASFERPMYVETEKLGLEPWLDSNDVKVGSFSGVEVLMGGVLMGAGRVDFVTISLPR